MRDFVEFCSVLYVNKIVISEKESKNWWFPSTFTKYFSEMQEEYLIENKILLRMIDAFKASDIQAEYEDDDSNIPRINVRLEKQCFSIGLGCCQTTKPAGFKRLLYVYRIDCNILQTLGLSEKTEYRTTLDTLLAVMYKEINTNSKISSCSIKK